MENNKEKTDSGPVTDLFKKDRFIRHIGAELVEASPGRARAKLEIKELHLNGVGTVQGGVIFTLADFTFAVASHSYGEMFLTSNAAISFCKTANQGVLYAEAREISRGRNLATYSVEVTDDRGLVVASFQGTGFRRDQRNLRKTNGS